MPVPRPGETTASRARPEVTPHGFHTDLDGGLHAVKTRKPGDGALAPGLPYPAGTPARRSADQSVERRDETIARTTEATCGGKHGFGRQTSAPALRARSGPVPTCALIATMEIFAVAGSARRRRMASPVHARHVRSIRMTSGSVACAASSASWPSPAVTTRKPGTRGTRGKVAAIRGIVDDENERMWSIRVR